MIIRFPTGLYRSVLPSAPGDGGNVTFTISNSTPPRTNLLFPKIPVALVDRGRSVAIPPTQQDLRPYYGELAFSVSSARRKAVGSNSRQFEIGQILDFGTVDSKVTEPMLVSPVTQTQHNNNLLDYDALGLSADDQAVLAAESMRVHDELTALLNSQKSGRADAEVEVNAQQKVINDLNRTISALEVVAANSADVAALLAKLQARRDAAFLARDAAITKANEFAAAAELTLGSLRAVAVVVK